MRFLALALPGLASLCAADDPVGWHGRAAYPETFRDGWDPLVKQLNETLSAEHKGVGHFIGKVINVQVPARDGVHLNTVLSFPTGEEGSRLPAVICRSPYGPFTSVFANFYVGSGFVAVMQDARGTYKSGGNFTMFRSANDDGAATLDWIAQQSWSNGEVYSMGFSADGMGEIAMILQHPKQLKGQWWGWTTGSGHDFVYPDGVYVEGILENYMTFMSIFTGGYSYYHTIPEVREHEPWGPWWDNITACREPEPCRYANVDFPVISSAGWFDIFLTQQLNDFEGIRKHSAPAVRDEHVQFIGPLGHCVLEVFNDAFYQQGLTLQTGNAVLHAFGLSSEFFSGKVDGPERQKYKRYNFFVMAGFGEGVLAKDWWTSVDEWPTPEPWNLYLNDNKVLSSDVPGQNIGSVTYTYDPAKPAPMVGGAKLPFIQRVAGDCGPADQSERERRSDVVVFESAALAQETAIVGHVTAQLFVGSSANDTDFIVTVSDYMPGAFGSSVGEKSHLVRHGAVRMRWRGSSDTKTADPMKPGEIYKIDVDLTRVAYIFPKGNKVRISVSSAAEGLYNVNYNLGRNVFRDDKTTKPVVSRNTVYFSKDHPSHITLPVVKIADIPPNPHLNGPLSQEAKLMAKALTSETNIVI
eukprot:TRINITY_DN9291_c0_g1_i1.p1 TRINITY_DN9291_c0_g1~~TRINITY_DN9291_c0_g1_i1.p1  ORF type:complete len:638 (-),score=131.00 TRINITY_DN9291_c0_g1_i1:197-2110(-)